MIDGGYLSNEADLATLREGIKLGRQLGNRAEWGEYLGEEVFPGPDVQTDAEIDEYIKNTLHTANALTGTCKMGNGADAVVTPDLRVIGVDGVRVADSSTIPVIPGGQTATPTVMIAERAAAFLRNPTLLATTEVIMHEGTPEPTAPTPAVA
jgi:choline dehydrogenase